MSFGGIAVMMIRREGLLLKAYAMSPQHHEDCDDPECVGVMMPSEKPFEWGLTSSHLNRRVRKKLFRELKTAEQKARSESLGG